MMFKYYDLWSWFVVMVLDCKFAIGSVRCGDLGFGRGVRCRT